MSTTPKDSATTTKKQTSTTESLDEYVNQFTTMQTSSHNYGNCNVVDLTASNLTIILSAASLATSLVAIITSGLVLALLCRSRKNFEVASLNQSQ